ncbi:MAG: hypothetical protein ACREUW_10505 [Burkholderiales bacterium]
MPPPPRSWTALAGLAAAAAWAALVAWQTLPYVETANRAAKTRLIQETQLWESDPLYAGSARNWTYFAAWLLTDGQLMERVRARQPERADDIEADYQRDRFLALAPVVLLALAAWGAPVTAVAAFLWWRRRRRHRHGTG